MFKGLAAFVQALLDAIVVALNFVAGIFPNSPFTIIEHSGFGDLLSQINFFVPVYEFISLMEAWLVAIALYYAVSTLARWVKTIE